MNSAPEWILLLLLPPSLWNDAGAAAFRAQDYDRAQLCFHRALAAEQEPIARSRIASNLAATARHRHDLATAETYTRLTLDLRRQTLGATHPDTVIAMHNLGDLLAARGRRAEALPWLEQALAAARRHDDRAAILATLARVHQDQKQLESALANAEALVEQVRRDLALRSLAKGRIAEARAHCRSESCRAWVDSLIR